MARRQSLVPLALLALLACAAPSGHAEEIRLLNVSYDPTRELHEDINVAFAADYEAKTGKSVKIEQSHGGSGKQIRAVIDGLKADVVTPAVPQDVDALVAAGLVKAGWRERLPQNASPYTSTVIFCVRRGNPKGIKDWPDLVKPGVQCCVPNPKTGGGARYFFLALWGSVLKAGGTEAAAREYVTAFYRNVPVLDTGSRATTLTFAKKGVGDCMVGWENEMLFTLGEFKDPSGQPLFEVVYPSQSVLGEPPVAVVDKTVDDRGTRAVAEAYLKFFYTPDAQKLIALHNFRPRDPAAAKEAEHPLPSLKLWTVEQVFGSWDEAQKRFFNDGAVFDQIYGR